MHHVAVFVGTRADLGPLEPVLSALRRRPGIALHLLTGVAFDAASLAERLGAEPEIHALAPPLRSLDRDAVAAQGELLVAGAHRVFAEHRFDALVVLGDRWELLFVVPQAFLHGIPIVHLHGGEVTEGALDERVRHAVTKLADLHCVASADAAARVRQLGEPPERIVRAGAPGLDRIAGAAPLSDAELRERFGRELARPIALFTYHPPTSASPGEAGEDPGAAAAAALRGVLDRTGTVIVTAPGYDTGRERVIEALRHVADGEPRVIPVDSIGAEFPRVLASVDVVAGNSSSGIIEAPTALVPSVDIGQRQQGRLRADSVLHADEGRENVARAVEAALALPRGPGRRFDNPYRNDAGPDGSAAEQIAAAIESSILPAPDTLRMKPFRTLPGGTALGE